MSKNHRNRTGLSSSFLEFQKRGPLISLAFNRKWKGLVWLFPILFAISCRLPYDPEIPSEETSVLVVEGYLDTEGTKSELKLSRTVSLGASQTQNPVSGAIVEVVAAGGDRFGLIEQKAGTYVFEYNVQEAETYQLEIQLPTGERFESKPIQPLVTPEIIDAGFIRDEEGVEIYISTQGDEQADDFLWTYEETWIYRPRIRTSYIFDEQIGTVRTRTDEDQNALCYKSVTSPDILLETSSRFQDQVVFQKTISEIPKGDERIMERYSILISQKAIDQEAVQFWEILKKNTEDVGSIFSPLPSLIGGNIYSLDDSKTAVIGQVSMGVVRQKRIYVDLEDVSPWGYVDPQFNDCVIGEEAVMRNDYATIFGNGTIVPARELMVGTTIVGYYPADRKCVDCTLYATRGLPDFWEEKD